MATAIKRDVQRSHQTLNLILEEIEVRKAELNGVITELAVYEGRIKSKRELFDGLYAKLANVFSTKMKGIDDLKKYEHDLSEHISKLEMARDLASVEYQMRKKATQELPEGTALLESIVKALTDQLDGLLNKINASEQELDLLKVKKLEFDAAKKQAESELVVQEGKVDVLIAKMSDIERERNNVLNSLAFEKNKLIEMQKRNTDSVIMDKRLTEEYQQVYESLPRRGKKN